MDRHKETEARKKDRHKPGYVRPSRRVEDPAEKRGRGRPRTRPVVEKKPKEKKPKRGGWQGRFIAVDGEGWNGRYTLLACSALDYDLYSPRGLHTKACLSYLTSWQIKPEDAMVGFGLSYDFENLLRDVPDEDYIRLINGEEIKFHEFTLRGYIPRKFLEVQKQLNSVDKDGKPKTKTIFLQDSLGFFQSSFIKALEKFNIPLPDIIKEGKEMRGDFKVSDLPFIKKYNREELRLLVEMMDSLKQAGKEAFEAIGLKPNFGPRTWFGPGAWASNFLRQTHWKDEHPEFSGPVFETLQAEMESYLGLSRWEANPEKKELEKIILEIEKNKKNIYREKKSLLSIVEGDLFKEIRSLGGIGPSVAWPGEYREIPRTLKRKKGRPLDEVADALGYDARSLLDAIGNYRPPEKKDDTHFAEIAAGADPEYQALTDTEHTLQKAWAVQADFRPDLDAIKTIDELRAFPFAAAFYGGRIEAAAVGEFRENLYDYDINSAYPFAISHLPWWEPGDLIRVEGMDPKNRIGMYFVEWSCPDGLNFYPFPYRSQTGNVFFPREGRGYYMAPEVNAAIKNFGASIKILHGYVLKDTDGAGDGRTPLPDWKLCTTAKKISLMAKVRLEAKKLKLSYEKALKLLMNSVYGKLIQQVGSHRFLNPFAASWITSTCRAIIVDTIGRDEEKNIISIMTDGILSRKKIPVVIGETLGEFEEKTFDYALQFVPGIYQLKDTNDPKKDETKYRGMDKNFNPQEAKIILWRDYWEEKIKDEKGETVTKKHGTWDIKINGFVTRSLALHQPEAYNEKRYQFVEIEKQEEFSLKSKRAPGPKGYRLYKQEEHRFFPPKNVNPMELAFKGGSKPYKLDLPAEKDYGEAKTHEELTSEESLHSLLQNDMYDLRG